MKLHKSRVIISQNLLWHARYFERARKPVVAMTYLIPAKDSCAIDGAESSSDEVHVRFSVQ